MTATGAESDLLGKGTVTVAAAVREYSIGRSKLYELMIDGALPYAQFDGRRLIPRLAIERLIGSKMVNADGAK